MNHYLYLLEFSDGMRYVGAHSTCLEPELDSLYLGSGRKLPPRTPQSCKKTILATFSTRQELVNAEKEYIEEHDCVSSEKWYNQRNWNHDKHGKPFPSPWLKGCTHKVTTIEKRKSYTGINRTPAQKAADVRLLGKVTGPNPLKGNPGTSNPAFTPWYYVTPDGQYHEIVDKTIREMAGILPFTQRQLTHRFHWSNQHKPGKNHPFKGWIFGHLPRPEQVED